MGTQNVHQATQIHLRVCLNKDTDILLSKQCLNFTCDSQISFFLIWPAATDHPMKFKQINKVHPSIKFDFNFSNKEINFLNTVEYKTDSGKLETKLYMKESDWQAYLHRKLEQLESLK